MKIKILANEEGLKPENLIENPSPIDLTTKLFTTDGIFSEKIFGKSVDEEEYSCECGELLGRFYKAELCKSCNSIVTKRSSSIDKFGWIDLKDYYVIKPFFYNQIKKVVGKYFNEIINFEPKITITGNFEDLIEEKHPFKNYGNDLIQ